MNTYEINKFSKIMTENFREIDILTDYWIIRGEVREISYKLNNVLRLLKYLVIADYDKIKVEKKKVEKEEHYKKLLHLKKQYDDFDEKRSNLKYSIENKEAFLNLCIIFADELIDWLKIGEKMELEIVESYRFIIENQSSAQKILIKNCKNIVSPSIDLFNFYSENRIDISKELDRIDNIEIVLNSCKSIKNDEFKKEWFNKGVENNISNLLKVKNLNAIIYRNEKEYAAVSQSILQLLEQIDKEKIMSQNKKLNFSMLLLALIGGIGVLSNAISIGDNVAITLTILIILLAFSKWLTL